MSKNDLGDLTKSQRAELSARVKTLRQAAKLTQDALAELANVTRATVINMEKGEVTPQADVLNRVLTVLGLDIAAARFEPQTDLWLSMMGTLIEAIPEGRRAPIVDSAIRVLGEGVRTSNVVPESDTDVLADISVLSREASKKANLTLAAQKRQRTKDAKPDDEHA